MPIYFILVYKNIVPFLNISVLITVNIWEENPSLNLEERDWEEVMHAKSRNDSLLLYGLGPFYSVG